MIHGMNLCIHEIPGTSKKKEKTDSSNGEKSSLRCPVIE